MATNTITDLFDNPAVIDAIIQIASGDPENANTLGIGELLKSKETLDMLGVANKQYPSELDIDTVRKANKEWWNHADSGTILDVIYRNAATKRRTKDSIINTLIGLSKFDPRLNAVIWTKGPDGRLIPNEENLKRIARVIYAKPHESQGFWNTLFDPANNDFEHYFIKPSMSRDKAAFMAKGLDKALQHSEAYRNFNDNYAGELNLVYDQLNNEYINRANKEAQLQKIIQDSQANNLNKNAANVEATLGGDPVNELPSYVKASQQKSLEELQEEELLKQVQSREESLKKGVDYVLGNFNKNKKDLAWWL